VLPLPKLLLSHISSFEAVYNGQYTYILENVVFTAFKGRISQAAAAETKDTWDRTY
jgi:hypothetical protein